jgi:hypothetical protein
VSSLGIAARTLIRSVMGVVGSLPADERDEIVELIRHELRLLEQVAIEERRQRRRQER